MSNKHELSNVELLSDSIVGEAIKSGKVTVIAILDTANPKIKTAVLAQQRSDVSANGATEVQQFLLGWGSGKQVLRVFQSYDPEVAALKVGSTFDESFNIEIHDAMTPFYTKKDGTPQEGRKRPDGTDILKDGKPVYRNGQLVKGEPKHQLITDYVRMPANSPALTVSASASAFEKA